MTSSKPQAVTVRRALLSVSDKTGIEAFAQALTDLGVELLSTGGTFARLQAANIPVTEVSDYTGFPEMMDGRVKTLHPKIHGAILGRRGASWDNLDDAVMQEHGIIAIDMVVVNLYPFAATVANPDCDLATAVENIDIGGPTMLRSAAKNHPSVAVVVNTGDYAPIIEALQTNNGELNAQQRFDLAVKAFEHTAQYDSAIANYLGNKVESEAEDIFPRTLNLNFSKVQSMRYGENPHQQAAFYKELEQTEASISTSTQLQGKALSYNNVADTDAALECVKSFKEPACVIVKHANPCGVATGKDLNAAYQLAFATDPTSAFGGIIAFNRELDGVTAQAIIAQQFVEVIIAPSVADGVSDIIAAKKNVRLLVCGQWQDLNTAWDYKRVTGGILVQDRDLGTMTEAQLKVVTKRAPDATEIADLLFCWKVAKFVKSNAIVYAKDQRTIGVGAGQMSRVYSAKIAGIKAADENLTVAGSVMASDAFFPFRDGIDAAAAAGIRAVIQPGGSMRDEEVIAAADEADIAMVFTGMRHFKH